jgi:predicted MFS family arabinose efflux permease
VTLGVLIVMAFNNGWRSMVASQLGMDTGRGDNVGVMSLRAAANQFGYLLGAAVGGAAVAAGGFSAFGVVLAAMFAISAAAHAGIRQPELAPAPA